MIDWIAHDYVENELMSVKPGKIGKVSRMKDD